MSRVNSEHYWDNRFKQDWDLNKGNDQSMFFMSVALEMLPAWLNNLLKNKGKSICDWGCAEGDGTNMLALTFPKAEVEGIDFAETAISIAKERYRQKNLNFRQIDLLTSKYNKKFDIVFSSNTFEHFKKPWKVFDKISRYSKELFVMMIPFNEDENSLILEHFYHFTKKDFQLQGKKWDIVHFEVINTAPLPNTRWVGDQALIIFAAKGLAEKMGLTFDDIKLSLES